MPSRVKRAQGKEARQELKKLEQAVVVADFTRRAVSPVELAKMLGLADSTVRDMIRNKTLPAMRCGRVWRISLSAVDRMLNEAAGETENQRTGSD
jgi:excisionase family DNA binding protein